MKIYDDKLKGIKKVIKLLEKKEKQLGLKDNPTPSVVVGYTQAYAIYVHENLEVSLTEKNIKAGRGAKYLENPARQHKSTIAKLVKDMILKKKRLDHSLLKGGLFLQKESQKVVPIDTGALRASAFTKLE